MPPVASSPERTAPSADESPSSVRRAHERAFRRWSIPAAQETDPEGAAVAPTFRVYTAQEIAHTPLRPSARPASPARSLGDELVDAAERARAVGPRVLAKWMAIGVAGGAALLVAFVAVGNLTDDTRAARGARAALVAPEGDDLASAGSPEIPADDPAAPVADEPAGTDFEIPDQPAPTTKRKGLRPPRGKRHAGIIRSAPF